MADISLGIWTTHGPTLNTTADEWMLRAPYDKEKIHWFKGEQYKFDELVELRKDEKLAAAITQQERERRVELCQQAIEKLAVAWEENKPDVAVIFGNDQRELILDSLQPMFSVYHGESFWQKPLTPEQMEQVPAGIKETEWAYRPDVPVEWPGLPELADHVFASALEEGFDVGAIRSWPTMPESHFHMGTPHAFSWIIRRVMRDNPVPILPLFTNTFFPPNQPLANRCYEFGDFIGRAIESWDQNKKVGVFASGGLTHFVIDESADHELMDAIQARDADYLRAVPQNILMDGTSEFRNWIGASGALFRTDLSGDVVDYIPCYRTEAGTGTANGFITWT